MPSPKVELNWEEEAILSLCKDATYDNDVGITPRKIRDIFNLQGKRVTYAKVHKIIQRMAGYGFLEKTSEKVNVIGKNGRVWNVVAKGKTRAVYYRPTKMGQKKQLLSSIRNVVGTWD